jgi:hypothetical protein
VVAAVEQSRRWHDVFWLGIFLIHLIGLGFLLGVLGLNRFEKENRLNIDKYTPGISRNEAGLTETYWPLYAAAGGIGTFLGWTWMLLLGSQATQMMKVSVHILATYLAVISVLCFWTGQIFWGVAFAVGAALQFLYVISVIDRYCPEIILYVCHLCWIRVVFPIKKLFIKQLSLNVLV